MIRALLSLGREKIQTLADSVRLDAMINDVTGFGTSRDKTTYSRFGAFAPLSDQEISDVYHGDSMAARIVDFAPQEMLRKGYASDVGDANANAWLKSKQRELDVRGKFVDAIRWARAYGGSAILLGADDGRPAHAPLRAERVKALRYLYVFDRRFIVPLTYYSTLGHPKFGQPETYMISPPAGFAMSGMSVHAVHESRLLIFRGAPTGDQERANLGSWDYSVLQRPHEVLLQFNTGWKAVETMLTDGNQAVFKMAGLSDAITSNELEAVRTRATLNDLYRSVMRAIVIDAGTETEPTEEFVRHSVAFDGVHQTLDKLCLRLAGCVPMPVTILMGQSPAGMNATGESDFRWFYDGLDSERENEITPLLLRVDEILLATAESPVRFKPDTHTIKFPPLWTLTPKEEAERRKAIAEADAAQITSQVWTPDEVALVRGQPDGFDRDIVLEPASIRARQKALAFDLEQIASGEREDPAATDTTNAQPGTSTTAA